MNMDLQERAIAYLKEELNEAERARFEQELLNSETLRDELERSRKTLEILEAASDAAITRLANAIVSQAIESKASDIHLVPERRAIVVKYRIGGGLRETMRLPTDYHHPIIDRFKIMAECNLNERRLPQEGRVVLDTEGRKIEMRIAIVGTVYGERLTARLIDRQNFTFGLEHCGLNEEQTAAIQQIIEAPSGLIMITGSFASGKTTMLYSLLKAIDEKHNGAANIITVEDPVEIAVDGWTQIPAVRKEGLTFTTLQRVALRNDPDVVMVGEIRDPESAGLLLETAITGHLVLSQLHVPSAVNICARLQEIGVPVFLCAQKLIGGIGMRLVPAVCHQCREEYLPDPKLLHRARLTVKDGPFQRGQGCEACLGRGRRGRVPLYEILEISDNVRDSLASNVSPADLWQQTFGAHGGSLWDDARAKIRTGSITVESAVEALFDYPFGAPA